MDLISRLLRMAQLNAQLDKHCVLGPTTLMEVSANLELEAPFHVLLEGECQLQIENTVLHLKAGDVVVIPSGASHRVTTPGPGRQRGIVEQPGEAFVTTQSEGDDDVPVIDLFCGRYKFDMGAGALLFRSLPDAIHVSFAESAESDEALRTLSTLMRHEAQREGAGTAAILSSLSTVLLAMVLRTSPGAATSDVLWTAVADRPIADAVERVLDDPGADWTIDRLSRAAALTPAGFQRRFRQGTGMTVAGFLTKARMMAATALLGSSNALVPNIGSQVGYRSESAFSRTFRAEIGTTPARFRKNHSRRHTMSG